jgi:hypothetical protein
MVMARITVLIKFMVYSSSSRWIVRPGASRALLSPCSDAIYP